MIKKIFICIFAALILNVSCEDDNPLGSSKKITKEYQFSKFTLSVENVLVQKYEYYYGCYPPDYEIKTHETYDTLTKTFSYLLEMEESSRYNKGDSIYYSCYWCPELDSLSLFIDRENNEIKDIHYVHADVNPRGMFGSEQPYIKLDFSKLKYEEIDGKIMAEINGNEVSDIIKWFDIHVNVYVHYAKEITQYTLLNTTDSSRIVLTLEMEE